MALVVGFIALAILLAVLGGAGLLVGALVLIPFVSLLLLNAWLMVADPARWLGSSNWWVLRGSLSHTRYETKSGLFQIRIGGAVMIGLVLWTIIDVFRR